MRLLFFILLFSFQASGQMYFGRIAPAPTDTLIGPSITWSGKTTYFLGDSWISGIDASIDANRLTTLFATGKGSTESNAGVSGVTMMPDTCNAYANYYDGNVPVYNSGTMAAVFIHLGLNDVGKNVNYMNTTRFDSAYSAFLDYAINTRGWPANRIYLISPGYVLAYTQWVGTCGITTANSTRHQAFNAVVQSLATSYGCNYVDVYTPMSTALNSSYYNASQVHLNDSGHDWVADWLLSHIR